MQITEALLKAHHPVNNFTSGDYWGIASEFEFGNRFVDTYKSFITDIHPSSVINSLTLMREVEINGCDIADLVAVSNQKTKKRGCNTVVRTFEFKLSDWRKGIMQATRFKGFSSVTILVIPWNKLCIASTYLDIFKQLKIGLWGFNADKGTITTKYTPRYSSPADKRKLNDIITRAKLFSCKA